MGVGDSEQVPAAGDDHQSVAAPTTVKHDDDPRAGQDVENGGAKDEEKDASGNQDTPRGEARSSASQSPRRVLFGSVREALIASERQVHGNQQREHEQLTEDAAGGGYVVLRQRQRSLSVGVPSTVKREVARRELATEEAPTPDAAGYTVIRRRASCDASAPAPRPAGAPSESKRRGGRRNHRPAATTSTPAASRGGDRKERRARTSPRAQLEHEPRAKPAVPAAGSASASHEAWQRSSSPLGSMSSLSRALADLEVPPLSTASAPETRSPSAAVAPPPGLNPAPASAEWLSAADRALWALPPPADLGLGQTPGTPEHQQKEEDKGSAWAAATSAGVLASRSEPGWPPPPSSAEAPVVTSEEDGKVAASWLGWKANADL